MNLLLNEWILCWVWVQPGDKRQIRLCWCCLRWSQACVCSELSSRRFCVWPWLFFCRRDLQEGWFTSSPGKNSQAELERREVVVQPGCGVFILHRLRVSLQIPPVQVTYSTLTCPHTTGWWLWWYRGESRTGRLLCAIILSEIGFWHEQLKKNSSQCGARNYCLLLERAVGCLCALS